MATGPLPSACHGRSGLRALAAALLLALSGCMSSTATQDRASATNRAAAGECRGEAWFCPAASQE